MYISDLINKRYVITQDMIDKVNEFRKVIIEREHDDVLEYINNYADKRMLLSFGALSVRYPDTYLADYELFKFITSPKRIKQAEDELDVIIQDSKKSCAYSGLSLNKEPCIFKKINTIHGRILYVGYQYYDSDKDKSRFFGSYEVWETRHPNKYASALANLKEREKD